MSEPTSALTAYDLVLDVALAAGIGYYGSAGQSEAMIPINQHDLEKTLRCVNRGIMMFISMAPPTGWRWMNRTMEVTLGTVQTEGTVDGGSSTKLLDDTLADTYDANNDLNGYYVYDQTKEIYAAITDYTISTGSITAFADYGETVAGTVKATCAAHGLSTNDMIVIAGTTSYNGPFTITKIDVNNFYFTDTYVAVETSGTWTQTQITVAAWLDYDDEVSTSTPAAGDSFSVTDVKTVDGDKARYPLSQDFQGEVAGKITYAAGSGRGHIIDWTHEATIRTVREVAVNTGNITRAAVRPWRKRRWELIVDPSPTASDMLIFPYKVGFSKIDMLTGTANAGSSTTLTDVDLAKLYPTDYFKGWYIHLIDSTGKGSYAKCTDYATATGVFTVGDWLSLNGTAGGTDPADASTASYYVEPANNRHPAGMQYDDTVRTACLAAAEREFENLNQGYMGEFLDRALLKAYERDARSAPQKLGMMLPGNRRISHRRTWKDVEYVGEK